MDLIKPKPRVAPEFQAVILAGPGSNLSPLTRPYTRGHGIEESVPKALLPIANKAMLSYPLAWLDAAGVADVFIVCPSSHRSQITHFIYSNDAGSFPSLRINILTMDDDESIGTADVLRDIASSIQSDFIVLPCDFIPPPELTLSKLLDTYRMDTEGPVLTALLYERGEATKDGPPPFVVGLDEKQKTILHIPLEESGDDLQIRTSLLWKSPNVRFTTRYLDSHVYVLKRTVLDLLTERTDISSIKEELIPWLCRTQYRTAARRKYGPTLRPTGNPQALALEYSTVQDRRRQKPGHTAGLTIDDPLSPQSPPTVSSVPSSSVPASPRVGSEVGLRELIKAAAPVEVRCSYVAHRLSNGIAIRTNTLKTYFDANRMCLREGSFTSPSHHQQSQASVSITTTAPVQTGPHEQLIDQKAQISTDSVVGLSTRVGERTSIKKSVIGSHCTIGKNVKISGCVLMDHVVIKDGAKLDNSIISRHTVVEERCAVKDSETATGVVLASGGDYKNERIEEFEYDE
ncbi:hypothetical protein FRB99_003409 [Tulasnella sp. 403]|nr:hypothetical protein FRB99_003409 [Tulasnella sp. 403]